MGWLTQVICNRCDARFEVGSGHTRRSWCLRCAVCGATKVVSKEEVEDPRGGDFSLAPINQKEMEGLAADPERAQRFIAEVFSGPSPAWLAWEQRVEDSLPPCKCDGQFRFGAPARCPRCRSTDYRTDPDGWEMHIS